MEFVLNRQRKLVTTRLVTILTYLHLINQKKYKTMKTKIYILGMLCGCCNEIVEGLLIQQGFKCEWGKRGEVTLDKTPTKEIMKILSEVLKKKGHAIMTNTEQIIAGQMVYAIIGWLDIVVQEQLITLHDYLVKEFGLNFNYLSDLFRRFNLISISRSLKLLKIERSEDMLMLGINGDEIARILQFCSRQEFSTQFKEEKKISPSRFIKNHKKGQA
jgi:AraC-like DNA-binding protein